MGLVGRVAQAIVNKGLREIQLEAYKNYPKWMRDTAPAGIDACPLPDDQGVGIILESQGKGAFLGVYPDPQAEPGEIRIYSRDSGGAQQAVLWLDKAGKIRLANTAKSLGTLINALVDEIVALKTVGSPSQHAVSPATIANLKTIKTEFGQLLKE
jgi:hypothetical protein